MKGVKKCCGLLCLLVTMLGLSLSVSSDVSAKVYTIDSFLVNKPAYLVGSDYSGLSSSGDGFSYSFLDSVTMSDLYIRNSSRLSSTLDTNSGKCVYSNYVNPGYSVSGHTIRWGGNLIPNYSNYSVLGDFLSSDSLYLCRTMYEYGHLFSSDLSIPEFDETSFPFSVNLNVRSMLPYNFIYNNLYFNPSNTIDGIVYTDNFDLSDMLNYRREVNQSNSDFVYYSDVIKHVSLPLSIDSSVETLVDDSEFTLSGSIFFGSGLSSSDFSNYSVSIILRSPDVTDITIPCHISYHDDTKSIIYQCASSLSHTYNPGRYSIDLIIDTGSSPLSSTKQKVYFGTIVLTTNSDFYTQGGSISFGTTGSYPNVAPGTPVKDSDESGPDWFSSLTGMFSFNVFNPFSGLYGLFHDNNSCVQIPTIASMLHTSPTVCPWFPQSVRNLLTPVFGLSSLMLLFGFVVRWLGASSGNFFEDTSGETLTFSNWYGDGHSFRRTPGSRNRRINK